MEKGLKLSGGTPIRKGDVILCPIFSVANILKTIVGEGLMYEIVTAKGQWFLKYRVEKEDLGLSLEQIFLKFKFFSTGLSVATVGHFWVEDVLLDEDMQSIWKRRKAISLEVDKEIDRGGPVPLTVKEFVRADVVTFWIARNYPRVFNYHHIGLFLLRTAFATEYLYADVLLNFFKIVELVTYTRVKKPPGLKILLQESKKLNIASVEASEIKQFYYWRGRDAAHDWDKVRGITRRQAVECKMWAEELIIMDMIDRS